MDGQAGRNGQLPHAPQPTATTPGSQRVDKGRAPRLVGASRDGWMPVQGWQKRSQAEGLRFFLVPCPELG